MADGGEPRAARLVPRSGRARPAHARQDPGDPPRPPGVVGYIERAYHGPAAQKEALRRDTDRWIGEIERPPGFLTRKWKQWKAGLRQRLT